MEPGGLITRRRGSKSWLIQSIPGSNTTVCVHMCVIVPAAKAIRVKWGVVNKQRLKPPSSSNSRASVHGGELDIMSSNIFVSLRANCPFFFF